MKMFRNVVMSGFFFAFMVCVSFFASGCTTDPVSMATALGESDVQQLDAENFDGVTPLRVRAEGMGVSVSPVLHLTRTSSGPLWSMMFDSSRPLLSVLSYGRDGELGVARLLNSYKFEVLLDSGEIQAMLCGEPLYFMLHADEGQTRRFSAMVGLIPVFAEQTGSSLIWLSPVMDLVDMDGRFMLTGHAKASNRIRHLSVTSDAGVEPYSISTNTQGQWNFSLMPGSFRDLVSSPGERIYLLGRDADGVDYSLSAVGILAVGQLGISSGDELSM